MRNRKERKMKEKKRSLLGDVTKRSKKNLENKLTDEDVTKRSREKVKCE
jgi:hypothetical protein